MGLEELIDKYEADFFFRVKHKIKRYKPMFLNFCTTALLGAYFLWGANIYFESSSYKKYKQNKGIEIIVSDMDVREYKKRCHDSRKSSLRIFFGGVGAYVVILGAYYKLKRKEEEKVSEKSNEGSITWIIRHHDISSLVVGASFGGAFANFMHTNPRLYDCPEKLMRDVPIMIGSVVYCASAMILTMLKIFKKVGFEEFFKMTALSLNLNFSIPSENEIKDVMKLTNLDEERFDSIFVMHYLERKHINAHFYLQRMLQPEKLIKQERIKCVSDIVSKHFWSSRRTYVPHLKKLETPSAKIMFLEWLFQSGSYHSALAKIEELSRAYGMKYDFAINHALFLDQIVRNAERNPEHYDLCGLAELRQKLGPLKSAVDCEWSRVIDCMLADEQTTFSSVSGERVKAFAVSDFIGKTLVLKIGSAEELETERNASSQAEKAVEGMHNASVLSPLALVSRRGRSYYVLLYKSTAKNLFEETDISKFKKAAEMLSSVHAGVRSARGVRDYRRIVEQRILASDFDFLRPVVEEEEWSRVWDYAGSEAVFDKDPHGAQWLSDSEMLFAIDFSDKGLVQRGFQLNKLVVESSLRGNCAEEVLRAYCPESADMLREYYASMIPSALSYACLPVNKGMDPKEQVVVYLDNADACAERLNLAKIRGYITKIRAQASSPH
jgi:hypothetical protein